MWKKSNVKEASFMSSYGGWWLLKCVEERKVGCVSETFSTHQMIPEEKHRQAHLRCRAPAHILICLRSPFWWGGGGGWIAKPSPEKCGEVGVICVFARHCTFRCIVVSQGKKRKTLQTFWGRPCMRPGREIYSPEAWKLRRSLHAYRYAWASIIAHRVQLAENMTPYRDGIYIAEANFRVYETLPQTTSAIAVHESANV